MPGRVLAQTADGRGSALGSSLGSFKVMDSATKQNAHLYERAFGIDGRSQFSGQCLLLHDPRAL